MQDLAIALVSADTGTLIKSIVRSAHFVGLALGLGAATALDLIIVRFLVTGTITQDRSSVVLFASKIVDLGLLILWASGVALLSATRLTSRTSLAIRKFWPRSSSSVCLRLTDFISIKWFCP